MIKDVGHRFRWCERAAAHDSGLAATIYDAAGGIAYNGGLCHQRESTRIADHMRVPSDWWALIGEDPRAGRSHDVQAPLDRPAQTARKDRR